MASLTKRGNTWVAQLNRLGRHTVHIGPVNKAMAEATRQHITRLEDAVILGHPPVAETARWLGAVGDEMHRRLAKAGLCAPRVAPDAVALGAFVEASIARRTDLKKNTLTIMRKGTSSLLEFFGPLRDMRTITRGDALDWHRHVKANYAEATAALYVHKAKQLFLDALDRRLIDSNPFKGIKAGRMYNDERREYVPAATILDLIARCPTEEWKLLFALSRFGGLRVSSETDAFRWDGVQWDRGRFVVASPKTEHHEGMASREVPLYPRLEPFLLPHKGETGPAFARRSSASLQKDSYRLLGALGVTPWPRLFQNLRSSCQTDLEDHHPTHIVCAWMGNSPDIARRHYLQVTQDHFDRAIGAAQSAAEHLKR